MSHCYISNEVHSETKDGLNEGSLWPLLVLMGLIQTNFYGKHNYSGSNCGIIFGLLVSCYNYYVDHL